MRTATLLKWRGPFVVDLAFYGSQPTAKKKYIKYKDA
jgi:hypothetical protein